METSRNYCVADFRFSITADETLFDLLTNYAPFEATKGEPIFALSVGSVPDVAEKEQVFIDSSDDDMPRIELYRFQDDWLIYMAVMKKDPIAVRIRASHDFLRAQLQAAEGYEKFAVDNAAMLLFAFTTATRQTLEMHASVTVKDGKGFLFLGKSGTGKSTHSVQWQKAFGKQVSLLNDDNPILRLLPNQEVWVYGSPWSGKTPCYKNERYPVGGIVKLNQAPQNEIHPVRLPEAYAYMLSSASGLKIIPEQMDALYNTISQTIQIIQVYLLNCLPDEQAAILCEKTTNTSALRA